MNLYIRRVNAIPRFGHPGRQGNGKSKNTSALPVYSGEFLAKNHLDARGHAKLAADLIEGRAVIGKLTAKRITYICRSNVPYVTEARKPQAVTVQEPTLAETLAAATPEELARELGTHKLWALLEQATS